MCIQSPGGLARIEFLMQWVWAEVWDSIHLTELPVDTSALDLSLSSDTYYSFFPDYLLFLEIQLVSAMAWPQPDYN